MSAAKKKSKSRLPLIITLVIIVGILFGAYKILGPNSGKTQFLYVKTGTTYNQLLKQMKEDGVVDNITSFDFLAKRAGLPEHIHPGKYQLKWGMTNYELVKKLRNGRQVPVKLVINKLRTQNDFVRLVSNNLEIDSTELRKLLRDQDFLDKMGMDSSTIMCGVRPDTYEFYWNTTADKLFKKLKENYTHFWTDDRREAAKSHGLNPVKATIMASIIDEETNLAADKLNIASVYLNRMDKGMRLQADPTVKFAIGDFSIKRVTGAMLQTASPYNTYRNEGLPPGPICTPSNGSIDAVLNAPKTNYIYFCAKADLSGASVFAATDAEHLQNARLYQQALNARGIH